MRYASSSLLDDMLLEVPEEEALRRRLSREREEECPS
jgi:hypothetical protein